jgi:glucokinase
VSKNVLAFDLGGTKLAVAAVAENGKILREVREKVAFDRGPEGLYQQMGRLGQMLQNEYSCVAAAIASAGPLDPRMGMLLDATNYKTDGKSWGVVPLVREVKKHLSIPLTLENDAASAALAEKWQGAAQGNDNSVVVTLGTGLGVGIIANGHLVRSGRYLHPEGGHLIIEHEKEEALCGCGNYGCAEAYLSGTNFAKFISQQWNEKVSAEDLVRRARAGEARAVQAFEDYGRRLALFMRSLIVMFSPEVIVLSGGFSMAADLFLQKTATTLTHLMERRRAGVDLLPEIKLSPFREEAGLLGAAWVAFESLRTH